MFHLFWRLMRRAAVNLWRAPLPSLVSVLTIGLSLFLGASFVLALFAMRALLASWGAQASVTLYLDRTLTDRQAQVIAQEVQVRAGEAVVVYIDKATALSRLRVDL